MSSESGKIGENGNLAEGDRGNELMLVQEPVSFGDSSDVSLTSRAQRQRNLQDLLRLSTQMTVQRPVVGEPLDQERRLFLEQALKSLAVYVVDMLVRAVKVLHKASTLSLDDDPSECEAALDDILDHVDHIDFANDFHKIGGFSILPSCLNSPHVSVRWRTAQLVGELTQNNRYCQHHALEVGLLPALLSLLDCDPDQVVRVKALYAVSCLVRNNEQALKIFREHDGFSVLLRALQSDVDKLRVKAAFFLSALKQPHVLEELLKMGFVELFATLVSCDMSPATEHLLSALLTLVTDCSAARTECRRPELGLRSRLVQLVEDCRNKEEYQEVCKYSQDLLALIFEDDFGEDR
ncbi:hsp70-binding protein 1-like [Bacillus rossius redtenbacheri]|uniref:hsp70-binding protein 1-like n=1 Tax=Bacillus rossius redtenbacheri TaxID=93214 RepID=UPI002FDEC6EF